MIKKKPKKKPAEKPNKLVRATFGNLYMFGYPKHRAEKCVLTVYGAIVGEHAFIFPEHTRYGNTPVTAKIRDAKSVFKTKEQCLLAQNPIAGWAWDNSDSKLVQVKLTLNSDNTYTIHSTDGRRYWNRGFTTKRAAINHALKGATEGLDANSKEYHKARNKVKALKAALRRAPKERAPRKPKRKSVADQVAAGLALGKSLVRG
jgi:poly-gamma-glutamate capsule biosynthesis protein CapA/YwtB (metallophosphatase superfamily)